MELPKKVQTLLKLHEKVYALEAKAAALHEKIQPRAEKIRAKYDPKIEALTKTRDDKIAKIPGTERLALLHSKIRDLKTKIGIKGYALSGGESAKYQMAIRSGKVKPQ